MEPYHLVAIHLAENTVRAQAVDPRRRDRTRRPDPATPSRATRLRQRVSDALYGLASALDPSIPIAPRGSHPS